MNSPPAQPSTNSTAVYPTKGDNMPTRNNPNPDDAHRDNVDDVDDTTASAEREAAGGFYADSPSDGPNRRGPDTEGNTDK